MAMQIVVDNIENDLEHMAAEYNKAKEQIKKLEESVAAYKEVLMSAAKEAGGEITVGEYRVCSSEKTRTSFDLKAAQKVISEDILSPFMKETHFDELRVKRLAE